MSTNLLVVGAGLFGLTVAEHAARAGARVTVIDRRGHIGGNAWSSVDAATGIEVHRYGAHIFHTSNERVWHYVNRFTEFTGYQHRVFTSHRGEVFPLPVGLATINQFFRAHYSPEEARTLVASQAAEIGEDGRDASLEARAISLIGRPLYEAFVRGYTAKQWQTDPLALPASIISRLPVRYNYNTRYFNDTFEGLPRDGYAAWLTRMADHPNIRIELETDFFDADAGEFARERAVGTIPVVYTGPLDAYFEHRFGHLSWRTVDFEWQVHDVQDVLGTAVLNAADEDVPYTRQIEFKHFHPERDVFGSPRSIVATEFSRFAERGDEPYYPISSAGDREMLQHYRAAREAERGVWFGGRLGNYAYLDMHQAISSALALYDREIAPALGLR